MEHMRCPNCQSLLEEGAIFCQECGTRAGQQPKKKAMFCSHCGSRLEEDSVFCGNCGSRIEDTDGETEQAFVYDQPTEQQTFVQTRQNPYEQNLYGKNPYEQNPYEQNPYEQNPYEQNPYEQNSYEQKTYEQNPYEQNPYEQKTYGQNSSQQNPYDSKLYEKNLYEKRDDPTEKTVKKAETKKSSITNRAPIIAAIVIGIILIGICIFIAVKLINNEEEKYKSDAANMGTVADEDVASDEEDVTALTPEETVSATPEPTATPAPEPTEVPLTISVAEAKPNLSAYLKVNVAAASATSTITQEGYDNSAIKAFDGDQTSSWQEGRDDAGIGESITGYFDRSYEVKYICLKLGNWRDTTRNKENCRPQTITITTDEFTQQFVFPDEQREFYIELSKECTLSYLTITIDSVYPGTLYQDTVIADVAIYGK